MQESIVTVLIRTRLHPDAVEQGKQALQNLAREVRRTEPDCLAIELAQDMDSPTNVTMIEKWSSREAYEGPHMHSSHIQSFIEHSSKHFVGPPKISFCHCTRIDE